jgi:glycosyltransferase involved in cell wall biosynthesis
MAITYSLVIPFKDEEKNIEPLVVEIEEVMQKLGVSWELICVDDGSIDQTASILKNLAATRSYMRLLSFDKNYGQSSAFAAGFAAAVGTFVITLDGDGQNDPADIPLLIAVAQEYDLVCGWRKERRDTWQKKSISLFSNAIRSRLCADGMHDTGCSLKVYRAECLKKIKLYQGMHRFLPALFKIEGWRVKEVIVSHRERKSGKTKYHLFNRSLGPILDMFVVCWMRRRHLRYRLKAHE